MPVIEGVDYAWDVPSAAGLAAAGKRFAVRYGGPGGIGKQLKADELARLRAAGLDVVANAEGTAGGFKGTAAGKSWAQSAAAYFGALGIPAGRPIYFSVDWDAGSDDWAAIDAALRGAASVIGAGAVGVYGSYDTVAHCSAAGTATWFWQTYAWSGGRWHPAAQLQQYRNAVTVAGADCDLTRAMVADYGQWGYRAEEADVTEAELIAAMTKAMTAFFAMRASTNADGMNESVIGDRGWKQPLPNTLRGVTAPDDSVSYPRTMAYQLLMDIGSVVNGLPSAKENSDVLLDALGAAEVDPAAVATLLRQILGSNAAAVGALLVS